MTDVENQRQTEDWSTLPWAEFQRNVFRLQKRIYQASLRGDFKCVHNLQRLLLRSYSARCIAVRQVSQENRGKRTPGVDGVASLTPIQRIEMVERLQDLHSKPSPIRRVYIPKPNTEEQRPLGIPVMFDRAQQALVKLVLEPEWEAKFEPNSYGFRPGRAAHDAMEAIFKATCRKPKYVLDADIEKCFDKINHEILLTKLSTIPLIETLVRGWLKAGILENGDTLYPEAGTPQGGVASPLLANIALHGRETALVTSLPQRQKPSIIRYADDFVILHEDLETLQCLKEEAEKWLAQIGLRLKPSKTRITHTLHAHNNNRGFDFLGFTVRQYPVGKHRTKKYQDKARFKTLIKPSKTGQQRHMEAMRQVIHKHRGNSQAVLIVELNRKIRGWAMYYRSSVAKRTFSRLDHQMFLKLCTWAVYRHPRRSRQWLKRRYWQRLRDRDDFSDGRLFLAKYADIKIVRHVKVRGTKSPFDGDWTYWVPRLGRDPSKPDRVVKLLKRQNGRCNHCKLHFMADDIIEVHHKNGNRRINMLYNLALLHGHCHDEVHAARCL